jgi:hypothetical protein
MNVQMAAEGRVADPRAHQQLRRPESAAGADHRLRPDLPVAARRRAAVASRLLRGGGRHAGAAGEPDHPAVLGQHPVRVNAGAHPRSGRHSAGQIGDMSGALRVDPAAERAGAALHAATGVAADRTTTRAQGLCALGAELAVAAESLEVERGHRESLLRRLEDRVELVRPADPLALPPL